MCIVCVCGWCVRACGDDWWFDCDVWSITWSSTWLPVGWFSTVCLRTWTRIHRYWVAGWARWLGWWEWLSRRGRVHLAAAAVGRSQSRSAWSWTGSARGTTVRKWWLCTACCAGCSHHRPSSCHKYWTSWSPAVHPLISRIKPTILVCFACSSLSRHLIDYEYYELTDLCQRVTWGTGFSGLMKGLATLPQGGSRCLQWSDIGMEDPLGVHCWGSPWGKQIQGMWSSVCPVNLS